MAVASATGQHSMRDDVNYRCVNHSCARTLPRQVNYCPYCGINQSTALPRPVEPRAGVASAPAAELHGATAASATSAHAATSAAFASGSSPAATAAVSKAAPDTPRPAASSATASSFAAGTAGPTSSSFTTPPPAAAHAGTQAAPTLPGPRPVRLRWILLALAAIWLAWVVQRPTNPQEARLEKRIERAIGLAKACKPNEAQTELIALQARASAAQLARLQGALDQADIACHPERARAAKSAAAAGNGAAQRRRTPSDSTRNLTTEARAAIARGDYRAAADKMEVCMAMVDASPDECRVLKTRAERLETDRQRCLANGLRWVGSQCE